jgi:hypothetical protein
VDRRGRINAVAIEAGGTEHGAPGVRDVYHPI